MLLTFRPTKLQTSPVYEHLKDYCVFEEGWEIGRIYELRPPTPPDAAWFWSITVSSPGRVKTDDRAPTFEDAKSAFRTAYEQWRAWNAEHRAAGSQSP
jgi:hypothetical protein